MEFYYDLFVNLVDNATRDFQIPDFHEWVNTDSTGLIDKTPLLKVSEKVYDFVLGTNTQKIPEPLHDLIRDKTTLTVNHEMYTTDGFLMSDGKRVLFVDIVEGIPKAKSKVHLRAELAILDIVEFSDTYDIDVPELEDDGLLVSDSDFIGLTRLETQKKLILFDTIDYIISQGNKSMLLYFISEYMGCDVDKNKDEYHLSELLKNLVSNGWSEKSERLLKQICVMLPDYGEEVKKLEKTIKPGKPKRKVRGENAS